MKQNSFIVLFCCLFYSALQATSAPGVKPTTKGLDLFLCNGTETNILPCITTGTDEQTYYAICRTKNVFYKIDFSHGAYTLTDCSNDPLDAQALELPSFSMSIKAKEQRTGIEFNCYIPLAQENTTTFRSLISGQTIVTKDHDVFVTYRNRSGNLTISPYIWESEKKTKDLDQYGVSVDDNEMLFVLNTNDTLYLVDKKNNSWGKVTNDAHGVVTIEKSDPHVAKQFGIVAKPQFITTNYFMKIPPIKLSGECTVEYIPLMWQQDGFFAGIYGPIPLSKIHKKDKSSSAKISSKSLEDQQQIVEINGTLRIRPSTNRDCLSLTLSVREEKPELIARLRKAFFSVHIAVAYGTNIQENACIIMVLLNKKPYKVDIEDETITINATNLINFNEKTINEDEPQEYILKTSLSRDRPGLFFYAPKALTTFESIGREPVALGLVPSEKVPPAIRAHFASLIISPQGTPSPEETFSPSGVAGTAIAGAVGIGGISFAIRQGLTLYALDKKIKRSTLPGEQKTLQEQRSLIMKKIVASGAVGIAGLIVAGAMIKKKAYVG